MTDREQTMLEHIADYLENQKPDSYGDIDAAFTSVQRDQIVAALRTPARAAIINECADHLVKSYPDHAFINAYCAAIRSLAVPSNDKN